MHRSAAFFIAGMLALPVASYAQTQAAPQPDTKPPACFLSSEKDPSGTRQFSTADAVTKLKPYLIEAIMCPTACYDEVLTLEFTTEGVTVRVKATSKCGAGVLPRKATAESLNYGCAAGHVKPKFTLQLIGAAAKPPKSDFRCSAGAVDAAVGGATTQDMKGFALRTIASSAVMSTDLSVPENREKFKTILQAFGVNSADAKSVVENRPDDARQLLSALASGDKERINRAAETAGVSLNQATVNDFVSLQPEQQVKTFDSLYSDRDRNNIANSVTNTFPQVSAPGNIYISPTGQPSAPLLPGNKIHPAVLGSIAADAQRRVCAAVSGPCYVTPQAQFATMMNETNGNVRLYGDGRRSTSLAQVYQPTAIGLLDKYRSVYGEEYALHRTDIRNTDVNPEWVASQSLRMQALVIQDKALRTGGDFQRTVTAYNGGGQMAALYGIRAIGNAVALQNGTAAQYWQEAYNSTIAAAADGPAITNLAPSGALPAYAGFSGSPFGNVNPFSGTQQNGRVVCTGTGYCYLAGQPQPAPIAQPVQVAQPVPVAAPTQPPLAMPQIQPNVGQRPATTPAASPAVAMLIAEPKQVKRGAPVKVSWSSIGMSTEMPCQVFAGASFLAQGNDGTRAFETQAIATSTEVKFTLQCFSKAGAKIQREAAVEIQ